tara:strand:- start:168 stop:494 length:327 start_codon:yes stop_codon:yes gene_type:complete
MTPPLFSIAEIKISGASETPILVSMSKAAWAILFIFGRDKGDQLAPVDIKDGPDLSSTEMPEDLRLRFAISKKCPVHNVIGASSKIFAFFIVDEFWSKIFQFGSDFYC